MSRSNQKIIVRSEENSIKQSNDLSMARLSQGLTLNQMQLFAFAIFSTQRDGKTVFRKHEFQEKFDIKNYHTNDAYRDSQRILSLQVSTQDLEKKKFKFWNVFSSMEYDKGLFSFKWTEDMLPHILDLKEKYTITDMELKSKFRSSFTWILYDYLKALYGYWHKELSKEALMRLFNVEERKSYRKSTAQFKRSVLDVAVGELNEHTELEVWYTETKVGNKITGFTLNWSSGKRVSAASDKQLKLIRNIHNFVEKNMIQYLSLKDVSKLDEARNYIISINGINIEASKGSLTSERADILIRNAEHHINKLEILLDRDEDDVVYYNWLKE